MKALRELMQIVKGTGREYLVEQWVQEYVVELNARQIFPADVLEYTRDSGSYLVWSTESLLRKAGYEAAKDIGKFEFRPTSTPYEGSKELRFQMILLRHDKKEDGK